MKVKVHYAPERQDFDVYVIAREDNNGTRYCLVQREEGRQYIVSVPLGANMPVYIRLPEEIARELVEAIPHRPDDALNQTLAAHVGDAIEVRNRMITMVESVVGRLS